MIRRIVFFIFLIICSLYAFSSCDLLKPAPVPPILSFPLTLDARISYNEFECSAQVVCTNAADFKMTFSAPESLKDMVITLNMGVYHFEILGISSDHKKEDLPQGNLASLIFSPLCDFLTDRFETKEFKENIWYYEGICDGNFVLLNQDALTGKLLSLNLPQAGFNVEFIYN